VEVGTGHPFMCSCDPKDCCTSFLYFVPSFLFFGLCSTLVICTLVMWQTYRCLMQISFVLLVTGITG
jgi:hypothetical protein